MSEIKILITDEDLCAPRRLLSRRDKKLAHARGDLRESGAIEPSRVSGPAAIPGVDPVSGQWVTR